MAKTKSLTDLSDEQKEAVLSAHSAVNALAAEMEGTQPGPTGILAYVQKFRDAVTPLLPLLLEEATPSEGEAS